MASIFQEPTENFICFSADFLPKPHVECTNEGTNGFSIVYGDCFLSGSVTTVTNRVKTRHGVSSMQFVIVYPGV